MQPAVAVALTTLVMIAAGGCGGQGRLSHRGFAHEASHVCRANNTRVGRVPLARLDRAPAARQLDRLAAVHRATLEELRGLEPPKRDEAQVDKWLAVIDQLVDELGTVRAALRDGESALARQAAAHAHVLADRSRELARSYGIAPCHLPSLSAPD